MPEGIGKVEILIEPDQATDAASAKAEESTLNVGQLHPDGSHYSGRTLDSPEISIVTSLVSAVSGT